jgi:hypothetical protein
LIVKTAETSRCVHAARELAELHRSQRKSARSPGEAGGPLGVVDVVDLAGELLEVPAVYDDTSAIAALAH